MKKITSIILLLIISLVVITINKVSVSADTTNIEVIYEEPICYQQGKNIWSSYSVGGDTIASSGCGLISLVNAVNYLTGNFIDPIELADYAYSIDAYNGSIGGGTARWVLYKDIKKYEDKYGFKVVASGMNAKIDHSLVASYLNKGYALIAHVYGHFIAIVGYNEKDDTFKVYDSAANPTKRHSYPYATWMTRKDLASLFYMTVDWICALSIDSNGIVSLDQEGKVYQNSKGSTYYIASNNINSHIPVSGYALDSRGIESFYYTIDSDKTEYPLLSQSRDEYNEFNEFHSVCTKDKIGFIGEIDTTSLSIGSHHIIIHGKTSNNGVRDVVDIWIDKTKNTNPYNCNDKTLTIDMSQYYSQTDIISSWPEAGINDYCFRANYATTIRLGIFDFSKFKKAEIYYSTDQSFDADKCGVQSVIGFKKAQYDFGYFGNSLNTSDAIAYTNMTDATGGWKSLRVASIDLSNVSYNGPTFLNGYNQESALYVVFKVVFYYNEGKSLHQINTLDCLEETRCVSCGEKVFDARGHFYKEATCSEPQKCIFCTRTIGSKVDHDFFEATCTNPSMCRFCSLSVGEAKGHHYVSKVEEPTCTEGGRKYDCCDRCNDIINEEKIKKLGHNYQLINEVEVDCEHDGYQEHQCEHCKDIKHLYVVEAYGHEYNSRVVKATYEEEGYILHECINCGQSFKDNFTPKLVKTGCNNMGFIEVVELFGLLCVLGFVFKQKNGL